MKISTGRRRKTILDAIRRGETPKPGPQVGRHSSEPEGGAEEAAASTFVV